MSKPQEIRYIVATFNFDWSAIAEVNPPPKEMTDPLSILEHQVDLFLWGALPLIEEEYKALNKTKDETLMGFSYAENNLIVSLTTDRVHMTEFCITNIPEDIKYAVLGAFLTMRKQSPPSVAKNNL